MSPPHAGARGFTLVELVVALLLLALMASVMFGSLSLSARSWDGGEAKVAQVAEMRQTQEFLRSQLAAQLPQRLRKAVEFPLLFGGDRDEIRYAAALPPRVIDGGVYYFRLALLRSGSAGELVLQRLIPEPDAREAPRFDNAEKSVLAKDIAEFQVAYFGREANARPDEPATWKDRWDDRQSLPELVRIEVRPERGPAWPALVVEPRRAPEAGCRSWDPVRRICAGAG